MRRVPLSIVMLLACPLIAFAQDASAQEVSADPARVLARLMTFDRNQDGRLVESELPERMRSVLSRDINHDRALDRDEILAIANVTRAAPAATVPPFPHGGNGYVFGDQASLSTRPHVEGALEDLRLETSTHERALGIVRSFMTRLEEDARAELLKELEAVLTPFELNQVKAVLERQLSDRGTMQIVRPDGGVLNVSRFFVPDPAQIVQSAGADRSKQARGLAAVERFKARIRPGDAERAVLLEGLRGVLSAEEIDNFGAALQRRPLVKAAGVIGGVVGGLPPPPIRPLVIR